MREQLQKIISGIRTNARLMSQDEATTKQTIILQLLAALGWNVFDADTVQPEYQVTLGRVDYALRIASKSEVFIEVKKPAEDLEDHQAQLLEYAFKEGVKLAVLTNGVAWWFYLPLQRGKWEQRKFYAIDLKQQELDDIVSRFVDFLSLENVRSGNSLTMAETVYKGKVRTEEIKQYLPKAWNKLIGDPDDLLVDLLNETLEKMSGYRADDGQVIKFIQENVQSILPEPSVTNKTNPPLSLQPPSGDFPPDSTRCRFSYKGKEYQGFVKNRLLVVDGIGNFNSLSAASGRITGTSRNGWRDWELRLPGRTDWILADTWRGNYA